MSISQNKIQNTVVTTIEFYFKIFTNHRCDAQWNEIKRRNYIIIYNGINVKGRFILLYTSKYYVYYLSIPY